MLRRNFRIGIAILVWLGSAATVYAAGIIVPAGSQLLVNTAILKVPGDISNAGTLTLTTGAIELTGNWTNSGTFTSGTGTVNFTAGSGTQTLTSGGTGTGKLFWHLTHSGAGTLQLVTNVIDIDGNFTNSAGIFNANGLAMSCAGNWSNTATFTHGNNSVTLDGTNQTLTGSTTFYSFSKTVTSTATLTFDNTATQTIVNSLTLQGASGQLLLLRSDSTPNQYNLTLQSGGTQSLSYLDVMDADASGGVTLTAGPTSVNSGNNLNWTFLILSISVSPSTWGVGTVDAGTIQMSTSGNKIGVTNDGNVAETFTLQIYDEDDRNEWTHSSLETGAGNNIYVLSGIFCAIVDSPVEGSFNADADSDDVIIYPTQQTATDTKFAYTAGTQNGVGVAISGERSLWLRLDMPTVVSGTYAYEQHAVTVRISCQQS